MYFNEKKQELAPFVNLRSDVGFKAVFADRNNKDILIGVLNMILPSEARIDDITEYSDREQRRDVPYGKKTVLDLVCRDKSGRTFVVEMQAAEEDNFFERCVYYASGLYHLELSDGERYKGLRPVLRGVVPELPPEARRRVPLGHRPLHLVLAVHRKTHRNGCESDN